MSKMISIASGFQYSVNIGFDLNNDDKLKNFIPTKSALTLLEDILLSTAVTSTDRARVLIGAYGKGKSHIVLMILSMLMKKDLDLFQKLLPALQENPRLYRCVQNYYESDNKILPVVITGSNTSLPQAFLLALQRTLAENEMLDIMPETKSWTAPPIIFPIGMMRKTIVPNLMPRITPITGPTPAMLRSWISMFFHCGRGSVSTPSG